MIVFNQIFSLNCIHNMRYLLISSLVLTIFVGSIAPTSVQAAPITEDQVRSVITLLSSFGADETVVLNVTAVLRGRASGIALDTTSTSSVKRFDPTSIPSSVHPNEPIAGCITVNHNLSVGSTDATTGGSVSRLQKFLGGQVTGYFGPATFRLVQSWQQKNGVTSDVNSFGYVGPQTRTALQSRCKAAPAPAPAPSPAPVSDTLTASPSSGTAPLFVRFVAKSQSSDGSVTYLLDFGDGQTATPRVECRSHTIATGDTARCSVVTDHVYSTNGTYTATLTKTAYNDCKPSADTVCAQWHSREDIVGKVTITVGSTNRAQ